MKDVCFHAGLALLVFLSAHGFIQDLDFKDYSRTLFDIRTTVKSWRRLLFLMWFIILTIQFNSIQL